MNNQKLALFGGTKTINHEFKRYNPIGQDEVIAAKDVVETGLLSGFLGSPGPEFIGGPKVQEFERACEKYFNVKHAVTVNSWTSGLITALGAIGIEPGDEVIVTPWTMSASATAILHWNAIPVFADIEQQTFNINPKSIEANISPNTKAIMAVDIFGHSCDIDLIMEIANHHNLKVITDSAQSPGTKYKKQNTGTLAHVGGYSLNRHKHIHTGEGGILVTNDDHIFERLQLIRNHAEAVVRGTCVEELNNMIGHNFRLGEIECAIGIEQLKKLNGFVRSRQHIAERLTKGLKGLSGLRTPIVNANCTHAYYKYPIVLDIDYLGVSRTKIKKALEAEGVQGVATGYVNVHLLPMYQKKIAYGKGGFPWASEICKRDVNYNKGICPNAEELHEKTFMAIQSCAYDYSDEDIDLIVAAFKKVWRNFDKLK